jgi:hypothetical protein
MGGIAGRESSDPNPPVVAPEMVDDLQGTLRNAALAMESWAVDHGGQYLGATFEDLYEEGLRVDPEITLELISTPSDYCILATHSMLPAANDWRVATYDSSLGEIASVNSCL